MNLAALIPDPANFRVPAALAKLTPRERTLLFLVGGFLFVVINIVLVRGLLVTLSSQRLQVQAKTTMLTTQNNILAQSDLWSARENWMKEKQPTLTKSRDLASVDLLNDLDSEIRAHGLLSETPPVISPPENIPAGAPYQSVSVSVEIKGTWAALVRFLHKIQQPDRFIVFETATVQSDTTDKSLLRSKLRVAKWYAPPQ